ncbi:hypothetical protein VPH35_032219 [Triticum aestivum]
MNQGLLVRATPLAAVRPPATSSQSHLAVLTVPCLKRLATSTTSPRLVSSWPSPASSFSAPPSAASSSARHLTHVLVHHRLTKVAGWAGWPQSPEKSTPGVAAAGGRGGRGEMRRALPQMETGKSGSTVEIGGGAAARARRVVRGRAGGSIQEPPPAASTRASLTC